MVMSRISDDKAQKIKESILSYLFEEYPKMRYTFEVAEFLIRDDEFILRLLLELNKKKLVNKIEESTGSKVRRKWGMGKDVYVKYKELI